MAVEIPVVVDIEAAFDAAAQRVDSAIKPLKRQIEQSTADLKLKVGTEYDVNTDTWKKVEKTVQQIVNLVQTVNQQTNTVSSKLGATTQEVATALEDARNRYASLISIQEKGGKIDAQRLSDLREAITILTAELEQRQHAVNLVTRETEKVIQATMAEEERNYIIQQEAKTISEINERINALRGKLENIDPKSKEWKSTAKEIQKATAEAEKLQKKLAEIMQTPTKPGSINRLSAEMQKLTEKWNAMSRAQKFDSDGKLTASAQRVIDKYKQLAEEAKKYGISLQQYVSAGTNELQKQTGVLSRLAATFGTYLSVHSLLRFAKQIRDVTGELEYQRVALGHLLQDEAYGNKLFEQISKAAVESPFRIKQLVTYTKQLAAYRIEQESLFDTTRRLADVSAGLGVNMNRLILAYGQVRSASVLRGQELRQFTEAGIPMVELLAEKFNELGREGTTTADVFKLISERAVPFSMIADIFEDLTDKGGMFYKMQEQQAKTLQGRWEKLKDTYDLALQSIGETTTFNWENDAILWFLRTLAEHIRIIPKLLEGAGAAWLVFTVAMRAFGKTVKTVVAEDVKLAAAQTATSLGAREGTRRHTRLTAALVAQKVATNGLTRAFARLSVAMLANPWVAAAAAVTGLAVSLVTFRKRSDSAADGALDLSASIQKVSEASGEYKKTEKLIKSYEKLASKTERSEKENQRLFNVVSSLNQLFPQITARVDDDTDSITKNTEALRDNNKQRYEAAVEDARRDLALAQANLTQKMRDREPLQSEYERRAGILERYREEQGTGGIDYKRLLNLSNEAKDAVAKVDEEILTLQGDIIRLDNYINKKESLLGGWKAQLESMMVASNGSQIFTQEQLENWHRLYDVSRDLRKEWEKAKQELDALSASANKADQKYADEWAEDIDNLTSKISGLEAIRDFFGFDWVTNEKRGSDNRLSNLRKDISEITNAYKKFIELRKYMSERSALNEIDTLFPQLKGFEPTLKNTIDRIQGLLKDYKGPKDKVYLDMQRAIDTEISNLNFDELKRTLTDELNRISEEIKRSEAARNLYNSLLDLTGDDDLSRSLTISVYGDVGKEFKDRIQQQLDAALASLDSKEIPDDLFTAISTAVSNQDFNTILKNIDLFPEEWQRVLKQMASDSERFEAERTKELLKTLEKAKTYGESRVKLAKENAERIAKINAMDIPEEQKKALRERSDNKDANDVAKLRYDVFKDSAMYIKLFDNLDTASEKMLTNMRNHLVKLKENFKDLDPTQLKEMQDRLNEIDSQLAKRSPFAAIADGFRKYVELGGIQGQKQAEETAVADNAKWVAEQDKLDVLLKEYEVMKNTDGISKEELSKKSQAVKVQQKLTDKAKEQADASQLAAEAYGDAQERINKGVQALGEYVDTWQALANSIRSVRDYIADALGVEDIPIVDEMLEGVASSLSLIASILPGIIALNTILNKVLMSNPFIAIAGAIVATLGVIVGLIKGIINAKVERLNQKIEEQQKLLDRLSYSYSRLEEAEKSAFGTDYIENYSSRLANLQAQLEAYRAQEEAERNKGKKSDKDKILDYQNAARDAMDKLNEMQTEVSEKFLGTDLASAARDFASAWIDAYKSFGSTTDALKEKFADMIQSMVTESLAARLVQQQLKPIFDMIDSQAKAGGFSVADAAAVAAKTKETVGTLNIGLNNLMNALSGAGLNVRTMGTGLTGIARDVQGASEESILGLAAGINTQNFYMAQINANVITIVQALTGATGAAGASGANPTAGPLNLDLAMQYWSCLPTLDANVAELLRKVNSVISPTGSKTNTNYVAVG